MKKLTIFEVFVPMESQEQVSRFEKICIDNDLKIWSIIFQYWKYLQQNNFFGYDPKINEFVIHEEAKKDKTQATETEFLELLKEYKSTNKN